MTSILIYNFLLVIIEVTIFVVALRSKRAPLVAALTQPFVAFILALLIDQGIFGTMGLLAYGVFIHTPLMFVSAAIVTYRGSKLWSAFLILGALASVAIGIDAFLIEPHALQISRVNLISPKLANPVRIVLIADLQMKELGEYERDALKTALAQAPDLIVFAGDYLQLADPDEHLKIRKEISEYLTSIQFNARLGVFAVPGNVDPPSWPEIFTPAGVTVFQATRSLDLGELAITGLTLRDSFDTSMRIAANERYHIVLGHAPDFALGSVDADLLLAGHTHGGQVVLPMIGPLITFSQVPKKWASGRTDLGGGKTLIVSRGVGMERGAAPPLRFLCRPEIVVIDISPGAH